jgi:thymidine phosphorylase
MEQEPQNTLELSRIAIDSYKENVAYLHRDCQIYRSEGFRALPKVGIISGVNSRSVLAALNAVGDAAVTAPGQLGPSQEASQQLALEEGAAGTVTHAKPPNSVRAVHRKISRERLDYADDEAIKHDIVLHRDAKPRSSSPPSWVPIPRRGWSAKMAWNGRARWPVFACEAIHQMISDLTGCPRTLPAR